jgi:hypothetical protein
VQGLADLLGGLRFLHCFRQAPRHHPILRAWVLLGEGDFLHLDVLSAHQRSAGHLRDSPQTATGQTEGDGREEVRLIVDSLCLFQERI